MYPSQRVLFQYNIIIETAFKHILKIGLYCLLSKEVLPRCVLTISHEGSSKVPFTVLLLLYPLVPYSNILIMINELDGSLRFSLEALFFDKLFKFNNWLLKNAFYSLSEFISVKNVDF